MRNEDPFSQWCTADHRCVVIFTRDPANPGVNYAVHGILDDDELWDEALDASVHAVMRRLP